MPGALLDSVRGRFQVRNLRQHGNALWGRTALTARWSCCRLSLQEVMSQLQYVLLVKASLQSMTGAHEEPGSPHIFPWSWYQSLWQLTRRTDVRKIEKWQVCFDSNLLRKSDQVAQLGCAVRALSSKSSWQIELGMHSLLSTSVP